jgi:AcrR family transcriptional regulator
VVLKHRLCGGKQRARSESDKALREQQILNAAEGLFLEHRFHGLTLADVARETGVTKAALYRYFRSKELLFIAVYRRAMSDWVSEVEAAGPAGFPEQFVDQILAHPVFCGLTAILHIALETGLSEDEAREFKLFLLTQTRRISAIIGAATGQEEASPQGHAERTANRVPTGVFRHPTATPGHFDRGFYFITER